MAGIAWSGIGPDLLEAQQPRTGGGTAVAQETGQFTGSGVVVWLRVDGDGSVLVFAARGFRSAFAHPTVLTADETDHWADALATFVARDSAAGGRGGDTAGVKASFAEGDLTLEEQTIGQASAMVVRYGAAGPAPVTATYPALSLRTVISTLRNTSELAKKITARRQAAAAAAPPPPPPPPPPPSEAPAPAPAGTTPNPAKPAATPTSAHPIATPPSTTSAETPRPAPLAFVTPSAHSPETATSTAPIGRANAAPPASPAATSSKPSTLVVPVTLPADTPARSVGTPRSTASNTATVSHAAPAGTEGASAQIGHVVDPPDSRIAYAAGQPLSLRIGANSEPAAASAKTDSVAHPAPAPSATTATAKPGAAKVKPPGDNDPNSASDSVAEKALSSEGRLPPSVLGDVIRQRQQLLQYCYTEFGLHADPNLAGQIVVRLVIQPDGVVSDVAVPQHHWSGRGADKVESCIHDRVLRWQFPAAQRASTHEIQLIFGR